MGAIPRRYLVHRITIEPYQGNSSKGPVYGPPTEVRCLLDEQTRTVRGATGDLVTSSSTAYCSPGTTAPPLSRVTLGDDRQTTVIQAKNRVAQGLRTPDHVEIQLE
ncbi:hypothetical protein [Streptomyces pacificus]|uniref:Uncharacterized protein n=1 Tax=Streptomyces pacificus TaxID=2705029 RepID=A0A6A0AXE2_9ACTN|nr:hypothetical protein [Streptomyces pacificus]GFH36634.1 hypothetical protein SCWH03_28650 [Streptomyces pacificus]